MVDTKQGVKVAPQEQERNLKGVGIIEGTTGTTMRRKRMV
jgi:hypothetical protein